MNIKAKKATGLNAPLYDSRNILDRDNYVSITGGVDDDGNKSEVTYTDTKNLGTGGYDQAVQSLVDVTNSTTADDKPA